MEKTYGNIKTEKKSSDLKILKGVLKGIPDIIGVYDLENTIMFYNEAGYNFYQKTPDEVKGKKCYEMLCRNEKCFNCHFKEAIKTKQIVRIERYIPELNKYMDCCYNPVIDDSNEIIFIVEQLRDITEKKILENTLKESEERYRQIVNLSPEAIIIIVDDKIALVNEQGCKLLGREYNDVIEKSIYNYIDYNYTKIVDEKIKQMIEWKRTKVTYDYKIICYDNKLIDVEVSSSYLIYKGKPAIQSVIRDITGMKKGLNRAAEIQIESLQKSFPISDKVKMESLYIPAKTVSGDFFRICKIDENFAVGILGDVSGKGISAALSISAFNVLFNEAVLLSNDPLEIINNLNKKVVNYLGERYIAACCFSLDFKNKEAKIVGAGINQLIFQKYNEEFKEIIVKGSFLGMFENSIFDEQIINFKAGDRFYFFTDGLEFILEDDKIKENNLEKATITEFRNFLEIFLKDMLTDSEGIKDDSTLLALEIK